MRIANVPKIPKSKYLKSSAHCPSNILDSTTKDFKFGFSLSEESTSKDSLQTDKDAADGPSAASTGQISENYYHMDCRNSDGSSFSFNFDVNSSDTS